MPKPKNVSSDRYQWAAAGDVNAFFGLMLDNIAGLLLTVSLLATVFEFPTDFSLRYMVPGTAIGVFVGDLIFFVIALRLAKRTGRGDITAMPLGLDTPSTFGMVFFVLGPAFLNAKSNMGLDEFEAAKHTWHIGICAIFISGLFKFACSFGSSWIQRVVPRAGLLGSLASIALVLISFLPLIETLHYPVVGLVALAIILTTLIGRVPLPGKTPGALGALIVAGAMYHLMNAAGLVHSPPSEIIPSDALLPTAWVEAFKFEWWSAMGETMRYMPIVIPFALATVVGGIDCTESAAAAGDEYHAGHVVAVEAFATLIASICGGVIQTTPYIGHPAYKAMGGRAAYTLATALFVGSAGMLGYFGYLYVIIPKPAVFPILVFIGLEITAQSFQSTPTRHYKAVAFACVPALAYLALIYTDRVIGELAQGDSSQLSAQLASELSIVRMLSSGFIITSLIWASALAAIIDHKLHVAAAYFLAAAAVTTFGIAHSPLPGNAMFVPWHLDAPTFDQVIRFVIGYVLVAVMLFGLHRYGNAANSTGESANGEVSTGWMLENGTPSRNSLSRTLEPEAMDGENDAIEYNSMDHKQVNRDFVEDLLAFGDPGEEVLDLGTGTARIPIELCRAARETRILAVDIAPSMLDVARLNLEMSSTTDRIMLDLVDAKELPYDDDRFTTTISNNIVHHIPDPIHAFREAIRVTQPGGMLFFRDLLRPDSSQKIDEIVEQYASEENEHAKQMFYNSLHAALNLDEVRTIVSALGFDPASVRATSDRHWTWSARRPVT